ncbi:MAG: hypothetical protein U0457_20115 [Candidatus Sericytochromatia bacterium]
MELIKVLFVCHGNYHRSPMAQGLFEKLILDNNLQEKIFCDSAGTACSHGKIQPHFKTLEILKKLGINLEHKAKLFRYNHLIDFDYIIAMDHFNIRDIFYIKKFIKNKKTTSNIFLLRQFDNQIEKSINLNSLDFFTSDKLDVPDPELLKLLGYETVYEIINNAIENFFKYLKDNHNF